MEEVRPSHRPRLRALDGLRGIAILLVLVHNAGSVQIQATSGALKLAYFVHAPGWIGVHLFFVLSGFLITGVLLDSHGPGALQTFWIRRAARIMPLSFLLLLLVTCFAPAFRDADLFGPRRELWWYWAYLCNWGQPMGHRVPALSHFWSLAVEEQFYVVWPLVALRFGGRALLRVALAAAVAAMALRCGLCARGLTSAVYEGTFTRMDALTLGGAAALVARNGRWLDHVLPRLPWAIGASAVMLVAMGPFTHAFNASNPWVLTVGFALLGVLGAAIILQAVAVPQGRLATRLSAPWLCWFGKYSYAIYVVHFPIASVLGRTLGPTVNGASPGRALAALLLQEALVATLSVGVALASWRLLEQPALNLRERLRPHTV